MKTMIEKFCQRYKLPERLLTELLSHMTEVSFPKGTQVVKTGERNTHFYLVKSGVWRAYHLNDGTDTSIWFVGTGDCAYSSWGYVNNQVSKFNIESVNDSVAYIITKPELESLFSASIEMANFGRKIFEQEIVGVDSNALAYGTPRAKERYLTLLEEKPELLQEVPLKYLASYLYITPQSLSRIRAGLKKR